MKKTNQIVIKGLVIAAFAVLSGGSSSFAQEVNTSLGVSIDTMMRYPEKSDSGFSRFNAEVGKNIGAGAHYRIDVLGGKKLSADSGDGKSSGLAYRGSIQSSPIATTVMLGGLAGVFKSDDQKTLYTIGGSFFNPVYADGLQNIGLIGGFMTYYKQLSDIVSIEGKVEGILGSSASAKEEGSSTEGNRMYVDTSISEGSSTVSCSLNLNIALGESACFSPYVIYNARSGTKAVWRDYHNDEVRQVESAPAAGLVTVGASLKVAL